MRPIKLTIQGFTSFAEPAEIDFRDLDLFAITGPTGAGKTSVLDAMTWALYGCTPRLGKCGAELISHGVNAVKVYFEFAAGGAHYRIARTAKRTGPAQVRLERWREGEWVPEDATGVRETSAAICKLVGLDFDAFKLSVILPQGEFDRFLRGDHAERRKILKALLGLEVYDRMREIAYRNSQELKAREAAEQAVIDRDYADATEDNLKALTGELRQQRRKRKENTALLDAAEKLCVLANRIEADRTARVQRYRDRTEAETGYLKACAAAKDKADEANTLQQQLESVQSEHDATVIDERRASELVALRTRADHLVELVARREAREENLRADEADLQRLRPRHEEAQNAALTAEACRHVAEEAHGQARNKLKELISTGSVDLLKQLADDLHSVTGREEQASAIESDRKALRVREVELRSHLDAAGTRRAEAEVALAGAKQELAELTHVAIHRELRAGLKKGEPCPVCEQPVCALPKVTEPGEVDHARNRVAMCEAELQQSRDEATRSGTELDGIPARLKALDARAGEMATAIVAIRKRVYAVTGVLEDGACADILSSRIAEIREAERELNALQKQAVTAAQTARAAAQSAAATDNSVTALSTRIAGLQDELDRLASDIDRVQPEINRAGGREQIVAELKSIENARARKRKLSDEARKLHTAIDEARRQEKTAEQQAAVLGERLRSLTAAIEALDTSLVGLEAQWTADTQAYVLPDGGTETQRATRWRDQLRQTQDALQHAITKVDTDIGIVKDKIERLTELKTTLHSLKEQRDLYEQLHSALQANRFIDHLLSRAYDDLCARGSEHLLRLSGQRYSFKAGKNTFSVIDAWNGDMERPAGTLSGGESFFASLALALALAESVSLFSGGSQATRLEALFLDEGVSTLDQDEALPAVIDALMDLQAGDRMIGVISHMENLASRLPARIEVIRNHGRSTIRVDGYSAATIPAVAHMP